MQNTVDSLQQDTVNYLISEEADNDLMFFARDSLFN